MMKLSFILLSLGMVIIPAASGAKLYDFVGNGQNTSVVSTRGTVATLDAPFGLIWVKDDLVNAATTSVQALYVADWGNNRIRKVDVNNNGVVTQVSTVAGNIQRDFYEGVGTQATLYGPIALAYNKNFKRLYIADSGSNKIASFDLGTKKVESFMPSISNTTNFLLNPKGLGFDDVNFVLFIADSGHNCIWKVATKAAIPKALLLAGSPYGLAGQENSADGSLATFSNPCGLAYNKNTKILYVADMDNNKIRTVVTNVSPYKVADLTINTGSQLLTSPFGLTLDMTANPIALYITTLTGNTILKYVPSTLTRYAGSSTGAAGYSTATAGLVPTSASLSKPAGIVSFNIDGITTPFLAFCEVDNDRIRIIK